MLVDPITQPDYKMYHHKKELLDEVRNIAVLNSNNGFHLETFRAENGSYHSELLVMTVELNPKVNEKGKLRLLVDFGQHAREYITSELALHLLTALSDIQGDKMRSYLSRALKGGANMKETAQSRIQEAIQNVKDRVVFKILPMENELGRDLVENGKLCERKNGRGVDPNRNWALDWGKKEKDYNPEEEYPGLAPFSEPETQLILNLTKTFKPHVWLNIHSGMEALFVPYDHVAEVPKGAQEAFQVIKTIHTELFYNHKECVVGSGGKEVGYLAHGTATDYMYEVMKVPLPFTFEIYGDLKANYNDCFKMFNPVTDAQMNETISVWLAAILRLIDLAPKHSLVATDLSLGSNTQGIGEIIEVDNESDLIKEHVITSDQAGGRIGDTSSSSYGWMIKLIAAVGLMAFIILSIRAYFRSSNAQQGGGGSHSQSSLNSHV